MKSSIFIFIFLIVIATSFKLRSNSDKGILNSDSRVIIEQVSDVPVDPKIRARNFEDEIRNLEILEKNAFINSDTNTLYSLWSSDLIVNTAEDKVCNLSDLKRDLRKGNKQLLFDRVIEKINITEHVAVVMGHEEPSVTSSDKNIMSTRFTDLWVKEDKGWKLAARQSSNIPLSKK